MIYALPSGGAAAAEDAVVCSQDVASVWDMKAVVDGGVAYRGGTSCT